MENKEAFEAIIKAEIKKSIPNCSDKLVDNIFHSNYNKEIIAFKALNTDKQ